MFSLSQLCMSLQNTRLQGTFHVLLLIAAKTPKSFQRETSKIDSKCFISIDMLRFHTLSYSFYTIAPSHQFVDSQWLIPKIQRI